MEASDRFATLTASTRIGLLYEWVSFLNRNWALRHNTVVRSMLRFAIREIRNLRLQNVGSHSEKVTDGELIAAVEQLDPTVRHCHEEWHEVPCPQPCEACAAECDPSAIR